MKIPVLWLSLTDAPPRGYWDQGLVENALDGTLGTTRYTYEHHQLRHPNPTPDDVAPLSAGGIVVLPGSYHAERVPDVARVLSWLPWAVLFVTSDEEHLFPLRDLLRAGHPRLVVYAQHDPNRPVGDVRPLGMQRKPDTLHLLEACRASLAEKPTDLAFHGQITHERRTRAAAAMTEASKRMTADLTFTESFTAGLPRDEYLARLAAAKLAPAPTGPATVDTFRLWEALEAHAVPIADSRRDGDREGYWHDLFGDDVPFPIIDDWSALPDLAAAILDDWEPVANRVQAWWQQWKRRFVDDIEDTVGYLSERHPDDTLRDLLTVVVPTSPIESHPSLGVLNETLDSIQERLPGVRVLVAADGVRPEQEKFRARYDAYLRAMLLSLAFDRRDVVPVLLDEWGHQANVTRRALDLVRTPALLFVEHDCPLVGEIPFDEIVAAVIAGEANVVRLLHEASILDPYRRLMLDGGATRMVGVPGRELPMVGTIQWSQRPHVASTAFYRNMVRRYFGRDSRTMIEDVMHGVIQQAAQEGGWGMQRLFVYAPPGDMKRSTTTDGRGSEPKFDMFVAYDGDRPDWGPCPTVESDEYLQPGEAHLEESGADMPLDQRVDKR